MEAITELLGLGRDPKHLDTLQVCLRAVVVFFSALIMMRCAHKRFLSRMTAIDVVLGFILASVLSRAVNGSAPLVPTIAAGFLLVFCQRLLTTVTFYSGLAGRVFKGEPDVIVQEGRPDDARMRRHRISEKDLLEEARLNGKVCELGDIRLAVFERNGQISVLPRES